MRHRSSSAPPHDPHRPSSTWGTLRSLMPYLWPRDRLEARVRVSVALLCLFLSKAVNVVVPMLYKAAVDALSQPAGARAALIAVPVGIILAYGLARVLSQGFGEMRDALFAKVGARAVRAVALQVFRHLHALSLRFHLDRQTGGLSRSIERGNRAIETLLRFMLFNILPTLLELALVTMVLWHLFSVWFALVTLVTVFGYIVYTLVVTEWRTRFRRQMNETDSRANTRAIDSLLNYETVKYFGNEDHEARRYDEALCSYERASVKSQTSLAMLNAGQGLIIAVGLAAVMYMAGQGIVDGSLTLGDFVLVNTYLLQLYQPLNFFGFVYREVKQALVDIESLFQLLGENREIADVPDAQPLRIEGGSITFDRVGFAYDPRRPILKNLSLTVEAGHTVAIVGPTGAGKSTISRLLFRFYDVSDGRILIDGRDIRLVQQSSVRAVIGIVPQDTVLFNDSIFYNIAYGRPDAGREEVEQAARLAHIHDFVLGLPDGYDTVVGERARQFHKHPVRL
ncbi:MAG: ABC transporter ATP-binding protein/permease, partial [Rhodospirillaceae bacterium]